MRNFLPLLVPQQRCGQTATRAEEGPLVLPCSERPNCCRRATVGTTDRVKVSFRRARARMQANVFAHDTEVRSSLYFLVRTPFSLQVPRVRPVSQMKQEADNAYPFLGSVGKTEFGDSPMRCPSPFGLPSVAGAPVATRQ